MKKVFILLVVLAVNSFLFTTAFAQQSETANSAQGDAVSQRDRYEHEILNQFLSWIFEMMSNEHVNSGDDKLCTKNFNSDAGNTFEEEQELRYRGKPGDPEIVIRRKSDGTIDIEVKLPLWFIPTLRYHVKCKDGVCKLTNDFGVTMCTVTASGEVLNISCDSDLLNIHGDCDFAHQPNENGGMEICSTCNGTFGSDRNPNGCKSVQDIRKSIENDVPTELKPAINWLPFIPELFPDILPQCSK